MAFQHRCREKQPIRITIRGVDVFVSWARVSDDHDSTALLIEGPEEAKIQTKPRPGEQKLWPAWFPNRRRRGA